jgi:DmsE family decaheme c-type cytochrome
MTSKRLQQHVPPLCLMFVLIVPLAQAQDVKRKPIFTKEGTKSCLVCHSGEKINTIQAGVHGESNPMAKHGCEDCHGPGSFHISRAHGGKGFPAMIVFGKGPKTSPREDQVRACLGCHTQQAGGTKAVMLLGGVHDKPLMNCSSCHSVHTETDPIADKEQQAAICYGCHAKVKDEHRRFEGTTIDFDTLKCSTCHTPHNPEVLRR